MALLAVTLAACQTAGPPQLRYEGVSVMDGVEHPLTLSVSRRGDRLVGDYYVAAAKGSFDGVVAGTAVTAELKPGPSCTYAFAGTLTATTLTGAFEPAACPGGQTGTWELELR